MEAQTLHRGRLIDHIQLVVRDLYASRRFYEALFRRLGRADRRRGEGISGPTNCSFQAPTAKQRREN